jgi:hypothetical protein
LSVDFWNVNARVLVCAGNWRGRLLNEGILFNAVILSFWFNAGILSFWFNAGILSFWFNAGI